jgi:hypothetical protein
MQLCLSDLGVKQLAREEVRTRILMRVGPSGVTLNELLYYSPTHEPVQAELSTINMQDR